METTAPIKRPLVRAGSGERTDFELVRAARAGDQAARSRLVHRHASLVSGLVYRRLGPDAEHEDIVQDCWERALRNLAQLEQPQSFAKWLGAITLQTVSKRLRARATRRKFCVPATQASLEKLASAVVPMDVMLDSRRLFRTALLPACAVLCSHVVEQFTLPEIARSTRSSVSTVKRKLGAAQVSLRESLSSTPASAERLSAAVSC